jgi:DoxX-like family
MNASNPSTASSPSASSTSARRVPRSVWTGRGLSGFVVLFLGWDAAMKLIQHPMAVEGTTELGYPASSLVPVGLLAAACTVLYAIPRTAVLGAILWTGYLGGAIATHVIAGNPLFSHTLFPIYIAVVLWGGLALRDPRVLALLAPRQD